MEVERIIPVLRIFDYQKAIEFYINWLGFEISWEHVFEENSPKYLEITKDAITLHLSEHHGDCSPGANVFIWCKGLKQFHEQLLKKNYKYMKPGMRETFYDAWQVAVIDPFGNKLSFNEKK